MCEQTRGRNLVSIVLWSWNDKTSDEADVISLVVDRESTSYVQCTYLLIHLRK